MRFADLLRTAAANVWSAKLRSALTVLGVSIGIFAMVLLYSAVETAVSWCVGLLHREVALHHIQVSQRARITNQQTARLRGLSEAEVQAHNEAVGDLTDPVIEEWRADPEIARVIPTLASMALLRAGGFDEQRDFVRGARQMLAGAALIPAAWEAAPAGENGARGPEDAAAIEGRAETGKEPQIPPIPPTAEPQEPPSAKSVESVVSPSEAATDTRARRETMIYLTYAWDEAAVARERLVAGRMIGAPDAQEALISDALLDFFDETPEGVLGRKFSLVSFQGLPGAWAAELTVVGVHRPAKMRTLSTDLVFEGRTLLVSDACARALDLNRQPELAALGGHDPNSYQSAQVFTESVDPARVLAVSAQIRARGFDVFSVHELVGQMQHVSRYVGAAVAALGAIGLVVAFFGVLNTLLMAVFQRTREIGVMRAVGARRWDVRALLLAEGALLGFVGALWGLWWAWLIGVAAVGVARSAVPQLAETGLRWVLPTEAALGALALGVGVSLAAALIPALRATRLDPVAALRNE